MMPRFSHALCVFAISLLSLFSTQAFAQCSLSVSDSGSLLQVDEAGFISTELDISTTGSPRTVGVKFEVIEGDAEFDGDPGPIFLPVEISGLPERVGASVELVARAAGSLQVQVTWLEEPSPTADSLMCQGEPVDPHSFDLFYLVEEPERELELDALSGDEQEIEIGETSESLVVEVSSSDGSDTDGILIEFEADPSGVVQLSQSSVITDSDGTAEITVIGLREGEAIVSAFLGDDDDGDAAPALFLITVLGEEEGGGVNIAIVSGDRQELQVQAFSDALEVQVTDDEGEPLDEELVSWRVDPPSAAELDTGNTLSDSEGKARNRVRALQVGAFSVFAEVTDEDGLETSVVSFALTALEAGGGSGGFRLSSVAGENQSLGVGELSRPFVVAASDNDNNPLIGASVRWRVDPPSAATPEQISTLTDSAGKSQNQVRVVQAVPFTLIAELTDGPQTVASVSFAVGAETVPAGSVLTVISGNDQALVPGRPSEPLVVELRNGQGQPLAGARLRFGATPAGAVLFDPPEAVTGADGRASTRVAPQLPGGATITVTLVGDPSVTTSFSVRGGTMFIPGLSPNQQGVAGAIDAACPQLAAGPPPPPGSAQSDLLARCSEIVGAAAARPGDVQNALNQLLPDEAAPQATASLNIRDSQLRNLDVRMDALRGGARGNSLSGLRLQTGNGALPLDLFTQLAQGVQEDEDQTAGGLISPWGMFLTGTIGRIDRDTTTNNPGFDGDTLSLTGGVDYRFSNQLVAGLALGYDDNEIALVNDSGGIDTRSLTLSAYGSYASDRNFYIDGRLAYGRLDFELERNIRYTVGANPVDVTATAAPEGNSRLLAISLGRNFSRNAWNFGGYVRGEFSTIDLDGYTEVVRDAGRDGRGLAVRIDSRELESRTGTLGARLGYTSSRDWGVLLPFARVEWVHEFEDEAQTVVARFVNDPTGTPITITGEAQDDGYGNVALGLSSVLANGRSLFVQYERRYAQDSVSRDSLSIGGRFEF